ncbi:MAG TPA: monovalent cation/H+ antiporter subunit A [Paracoccus sp.]|nr:monovalent cation/H+ antiporter subunit A [Paracoccus sp. (in: a-proteobacteria)]
MFEQNLLLILALLPFGGAVIAATLPSNARNAEAWLAGLVMVAGLAILAVFHPLVQDGGRVLSRLYWVPSLGLNLTFRIDGFAWLFMVLVQGIGLMVVLYARYYMSPKDPVPRFYAFLLAFAGAMSGVLLSGNIIMLVVFWELTAIFSFLLIGYWHHLASAREGARMALTVTGLGGLSLLGGMLLIGHMAGSYDLERVLQAGDVIRAHPLYLPALALFLLGAFTKSAQFPFHFWLPNAMAAPTPVSAYLHSATMVKAGVFLLVRFSPVLGGTDAWFIVVVGTGMVTLVLGAVAALFRHDLKGLLAYSTISHLGLITALAGMGSPLAIVAAIFHIANHAVFKASLFMAAGIIDHETGTRDMRRLGGLMKSMPRTGMLAIIAAAAMAGVPLLNGFLSKEMFFAEAAAMHNETALDAALPWLATIAGTFSVAYSLRFIMSVFFGPVATDLPKEPMEPPAWMRRPVEVLVLACLAVGILPALTLGPWLSAAAGSVLGAELPYYSLSVWHGVNAALIMSISALALGTIIYFVAAKRIDAGPEGPPLLHHLRAQKVYDWLMLRAAWKWPRVFYSIIGTERLQPQLRMLILLGLAGGGAVLWGRMLVPDLSLDNFDPVFALIWLVGGIAALGAAHQAKYHRFAAIILMSVAGLVSCISFAWLSAPDLAVTQLLVEIVTTVLLLLGLRWLPRRSHEIAADKLLPARLRRSRDFVIAVGCGAGIAAVSFAVMMIPAGTSVGDWFLRNAYTEGGGTNVVNVILVDFRAFDTYGEITVLAIVGLAVFALLRRFRPSAESTGIPEQRAGQGEQSLEDYLLIPSVLMQWMFAPIIALSAYLFFRGHDLPGGGFAAGITLAIGLLLQYLAASVRWIEMRLIILPIRWMGIGLLIATGTGAGSWLFGYPFLTMHARYVDLPFIGEVPAATALLFDAGVFGVVVGAVVLMLIAIAHQSLRSERLRSQEEADPERRAG